MYYFLEYLSVFVVECLRNSISFYGKWSQPKYLKFLGTIRYYSSSQVPPDEIIEKQSSGSGGIPEKGLGGIPEQTDTPSPPTSSPNDAEDPKLQKEQKIVKSMCFKYKRYKQGCNCLLRC